MIDYEPTNTFASFNFDVLTMDGIEDPSVNLNKLATLDIEESYFSEAVKFINERRAEVTGYKKELYTALAEATEDHVVLESFSDFFIKIKEVIDKFLKFIKRLFMRFLNTINSIIGNEKYLEQHKKDLSDFNTKDEFSFEGYKYTFTENTPQPDAILDFNTSFFDDLITKLPSGDLTSDAVKNAVKAIDLDRMYSSFRAQVINKTGIIDIVDYPTELYRVYRDDCEDTVTIDVDRTYVILARDRFFGYKTTKSYVDRQYKKIEEAYKRVENEVKAIAINNGNLNAKAFMDRLPDGIGIRNIGGQDINTSGLLMSSDIMAAIDLYVKTKTEQVQEYSNIHTLAFAAKLDAMRECHIQDKNTLYSALGKIYRPAVKRS